MEKRCDGAFGVALCVRALACLTLLGVAGSLRAEEPTIPATPSNTQTVAVDDTTYGTLTVDTTLVFSDAGRPKAISAQGRTLALRGNGNGQTAHYAMGGAIVADNVKILEGRWVQGDTANEGIDLTGIQALWVTADDGAAGQFWAKNGKLPKKLYLGTSGYSENNAYDHAAVRVDADLAFPEVTILAEGSKITQGRAFTIAKLSGSGDLRVDNYLGPFNVTLADATAYAGALTRTAGTLTLGSSLPSGTLALSNTTLALGAAPRTVKSATLTNVTLTADALPAEGTALVSAGEALTVSGTLTVRIAGALQSGTYAILKGQGLTLPETCAIVSGTTPQGDLLPRWSVEEDTLSVTLIACPEEGGSVVKALSEESLWSKDVEAQTGDTLTLNIGAPTTLAIDQSTYLRALTLNDASTDGSASLTFTRQGASLASAATAVNVDTDARNGVHTLGDITLAEGKTLTVGDIALRKLTGTGTLLLDCATAPITPTRETLTALRDFPGTIRLQGKGNNGVTLNYGAREDTALQGRWIFENGTHTMTYGANRGRDVLGAEGSLDNPNIHIKAEATLNAKWLDFSGWEGSYLPNGVILVEGTLNIRKSEGTGYFRDRLVLDNGATVTTENAANYMYFYGGAGNPGQENITLRSGNATISGGTLNIKDDTAVAVPEGGTLTVKNPLGGAQRLIKRGKGTLLLESQKDGLRSEGTGEIVVEEGTLVPQAVYWSVGGANIGYGPGNKRTIRVKAEATLDLRQGDATGYNNEDSIIALEGSTMNVYKRDSIVAQLWLTGGTVLLRKGASEGSRGYDFYNDKENLVKVLAEQDANAAAPTVSRFTYEDGASELDTRVSLRRGTLAIDVEENARLEVDTQLRASADNKGPITGLTKRGAGELLLKKSATYAGHTAIEGGTLRLAEGVSLPTGGLTLANGARLDGSVTVTAGKTFGGNGTVTGQVTLAEGATLRVAPGLPLVVEGGFACDGRVDLEIDLPARPGRDGVRVPYPQGISSKNIGEVTLIVAGVPANDLTWGGNDSEGCWEITAPDRAALENATLLHRFDFEETMCHTDSDGVTETAIAPVDKGLGARARPIPTDIDSCDIFPTTDSVTTGEGESATDSVTAGEGESATTLKHFKFGASGMKVQQSGADSDGFHLFNKQGLGCGADTGFTLSFHALVGTKAADTGPLSFALGKPGASPADGWNVRFVDNGTNYTLYAYRANGGSAGYGTWQTLSNQTLPYATNAWTHYAIVARPATKYLTLDLYVDGAWRNTLTFDGNRDNGLAIPMQGLVLTELVIGRSRVGAAATDENNSGYATNPTLSWIDEVALFDRALPAPGIAWLKEHEAAVPPASATALALVALPAAPQGEPPVYATATTPTVNVTLNNGALNAGWRFYNGTPSPASSLSKARALHAVTVAFGKAKANAAVRQLRLSEGETPLFTTSALEHAPGGNAMSSRFRFPEVALDPTKAYTLTFLDADGAEVPATIATLGGRPLVTLLLEGEDTQPHEWSATVGASLDGETMVAASTGLTKPLREITADDTVTLTVEGTQTFSLTAPLTPAKLIVNGGKLKAADANAEKFLLGVPFAKYGTGTLVLAQANTGNSSAPIDVCEGTLALNCGGSNGPGEYRTITVKNGATLSLSDPAERKSDATGWQSQASAIVLGPGAKAKAYGRDGLTASLTMTQATFLQMKGTIQSNNDCHGFCWCNPTTSLVTVKALPGATPEAPTESCFTHEEGCSGKEKAMGIHDSPLALCVEANARLRVENVLSAASSGAQPLYKRGAGELVLAAANTYTARTTVQAGTLTLEGSVAGPMTVVAGATIAGGGTLEGRLTLAEGATLRVGDRPLTVKGGLDAAGFTLACDRRDLGEGLCVLQGEGLSAPDRVTVTFGGEIDDAVALEAREDGLYLVRNSPTIVTPLVSALEEDVKAALFAAATQAGFTAITLAATHADGTPYAALDPALPAAALFDGILTAQKGEGAEGIVTVAYDFGICWIGVHPIGGVNYVIVEAELQGGTFANGTTVSLVDQAGTPLANVESVTSRDGDTLGIATEGTKRWFRMPLDTVSGTFLFRARAARE